MERQGRDHRMRIWVLGIGLLGALLFRPTEGAVEARVSIVESSASGIVVRLDVPPAAAMRMLTAGEKGVWLHGGGLAGQAANGLPTVSVLLGVPPDVRLSLTVDPAARPERFGWQALDGAACDAGTANREAKGVEGEAATDARDGTVGQPLSGPPLAELGDEAWLRELRVVRLVFRPFVVREGAGVDLWPSLVARIAFEGAVETDGGRPDPLWDPILARTVANWDAARQWRLSRGLVSPPVVNPLAGAGGWKVAVRQTGWQSLTVNALTQTGLPPGTPPEAIRLYDRNREIALKITGGEDGRLEGQDRIAFYGQSVDNRYTNTNVYWLDVVRSGAGKRVAVQSAAPLAGEPLAAFTETLRLEQDNFYDGRTPPLDGEDHFYWQALEPGRPDHSRMVIRFDLSGLQTGPGQIRLRLKGASSSEHELRLSLNGQLIGTERWRGPTERIAGVERSPQAEFRSLSNELVIEAVGEVGSRILVDWLEVDYPRDFDARGQALEFTAEADAPCQVVGLPSRDVQLLDVTEPEAPISLAGAVIGGTGPFAARFQVLAGHRYLVVPEGGHLTPTVNVDTPDDLTAPTAADVIIVSHHELRVPAIELRTHRAMQGFRVRVVDVQDAFDAFSDGEPDPAAIQALVAGAFVWWRSPPPAYLVLLGDGHVDYRGHLGGPAWRVPVYMVEDDLAAGEVASDNAFATVSGNDALPDIIVGRIPVSTVPEAQRLVGRVLAYERQGGQSWHVRSAFFADDGPADAPTGSTYGELLAALPPALPEGFEYDSMVLASAGEPSAATMRARIAEVFEEGRGLLAFLGEGARERWAEEPVWTVGDATALINQALPVVLELSPRSGDFASPTQPSLAEAHVLSVGGGAIASWASAGDRVGPGHEILAAGWLRGVHEERLRGGAAAVAGKLALHTLDAAKRDLIVGFNWLGDPVLAVLGILPRDPASPTPLGSPTGTATPAGTAVPTATVTAAETVAGPTASATPTAPLATLPVVTPTHTSEPADRTPTPTEAPSHGTPTRAVTEAPRSGIYFPQLLRNKSL